LGILVLGLRLTVPLTVCWPLFGGLLAVAADTVDILIFQAFGFPVHGYHQIDSCSSLLLRSSGRRAGLAAAAATLLLRIA
jgi:hypothetical protein